MAASIVLAAFALRAGLALRRARRSKLPRTRTMRSAHLRLAKPAVAFVLVGFVGGPLSSLLLRDWRPFEKFHGWLGLLVAGLFAAVAVLGRRLERGRSRAFEAHALLGLLAVALAALAAVAGFVLLP